MSERKEGRRVEATEKNEEQKQQVVEVSVEGRKGRESKTREEGPRSGLLLSETEGLLDAKERR